MNKKIKIKRKIVRIRPLRLKGMPIANTNLLWRAVPETWFSKILGFMSGRRLSATDTQNIIYSTVLIYIYIYTYNNTVFINLCGIYYNNAVLYKVMVYNQAV